MKKEIFSIIASLGLSFLFFLLLFGVLSWGFFISAGLTVVLYGALSLLFRPAGRIGKIKVETLRDGEFLSEKMEEAKADFKNIERSMGRIEDLELKEESAKLHRTAGNILRYLEGNPEKIPQARKFIDYYQETASQLLEQYVDLQNTDLNTEDIRKLKTQTRTAVCTLNQAFENQFQKLMSDKLLDMEAELQVLRQTVKMEGYPLIQKENEDGMEKEPRESEEEGGINHV